MADLLISEELQLSIDYVTKTAAIFAQRRKGKTYTASVIAEELYAAGIPWVALDPTGSWWGLRAGANKGDDGIPVVVLGGQHGDFPLDPDSGRQIAKLVVDHPGWYVLDISQFTDRKEERRFSAAFGDALLREKRKPGRDFPMHLFVDEADMFVPQEKEQGDQATLAAFQAIVRRGGLAGLGTTLISQRPALVNKSVLVQLDLLILLRLIAGNDQDYIKKNYLDRQGTREQVAEVMAGWASLPIGTGWFWEPGAEPPLFQCVQVRERHTFNSSVTPRPGEARIEPGKFAAVDLEPFMTAMADSIKKADAEDPVKLRRTIALLERELRERPTPEPAPAPEPQRIPVLSREDLASIDSAKLSADGLVEAGLQIVAELRRVGVEALDAATAPRPAQPVVTAPAVRPKPSRPTPPPQSNAVPSGEPIPGGAPTKIVQTLAHFPAGLAQARLGTLSGIGSKKSTLRNALTALRKLGYIDTSGSEIVLTPEGLAAAGPVPELPTGPELLDHWRGEIGSDGSAPRLVFDALVREYPRRFLPPELHTATGIEEGKSTLRNAVTTLANLGLVERVKGAVGADPDLMEAAL